MQRRQQVDNFPISVGGQSGDRYDHPSPQTVVVRSSNPTIPFSLPLIQQYYTNLQRKNQDYAFFQVIFCDFPMADSLKKLFGTVITLLVVIDMEFANLIDPTDEASSQVQFQINLSTAGVRNIEQLAQEIRLALVTSALHELSVGTMNSYQKSIIQRFLTHLNDFIYDSSSGKFALILSPKLTDETLLQQPGAPSRFIQAIRLAFYPVESLNKQQALLLASMFGGTVTGNQADGWGFESILEVDQPNVISNRQIFYTVVEKLDSYPTLFTNLDSITLYSQYVPRLFYDDYIYILGSPEPAIWNPDGSKEGAICVIPRNRPFAGQQSSDGGQIKTNTDRIKAPLASIRNMTLKICDREGNLLNFDEEFSLHFCVSFDID